MARVWARVRVRVKARLTITITPTPTPTPTLTLTLTLDNVLFVIIWPRLYTMDSEGVCFGS